MNKLDFENIRNGTYYFSSWEYEFSDYFEYLRYKRVGRKIYRKMNESDQSNSLRRHLYEPLILKDCKE